MVGTKQGQNTSSIPLKIHQFYNQRKQVDSFQFSFYMLVSNPQNEVEQSPPQMSAVLVILIFFKLCSRQWDFDSIISLPQLFSLNFVEVLYITLEKCRFLLWSLLSIYENFSSGISAVPQDISEYILSSVEIRLKYNYFICLSINASIILVYKLYQYQDIDQ